MLDLLLTLFCVLLGLTLHPTPKAAAKPATVQVDGAVQARLMKRYGDLPLSFEANRGQADPRVKFVAHGRGYSMFFGSSGVVLGLTGSSRAKQGVTTALGMHLVRANPAPRVSGVDPLPGKSNYFIGDDPRQWRTGVPTYRKVRYSNVYPGVDLIYYGNQRQLEYDFVVAPQADPTRLRLRLDGAGRMAVDAAGDLVVETDGGEVRFHKPVVYQSSQDSGTPDFVPQSRARVRWLDGHYVLKGNHEIGFAVADYDRRNPLVIDPVLTYSTYLGGNGGDAGQGIAVDAAGNAYVTGSTASLNFPTSTPFQKSSGGGSDVFVAKLNPAGTALVYATYLGGSGDDGGTAIALDSARNAYVTGNTASPNFPTTTGVFQASYGGSGDAFVTELNAAGAALVYSSYLGGSGADFGQGIAVDSAMNAYVTGSTQSTDFPTVKPLQGGNDGAADVFVAKVNPTGSALVYSTYLGGSGADSGQGIAVDTLGNAYVAGSTASANFPVSTTLQPSSGGGTDGFVAKLNPAGSALVYSTYLGGSGMDRALAIALDPSGDAYVAGDTTSANFPATAGAFQTANNGTTDAFISKLNPAGSALLYSTLLGGGDLDSATGIAVDAFGNTYVTGLTRSSNFPTVRPSQMSLGGGQCGANVCPDAFVTELNPQGALLVYSTYLGGSGADGGQGIALGGPSGNAYVTGGTASPNFTAIVGAFQGTYGGIGTSGNAFVTAINAADAPGLAVTPQPVNFGNQALGIASAAQTLTVTNAGSAPLNIATVTANGDFAQTNTCVGALAAGGGTCTINATFTPAALGARTGDITLTDNAAGSPQLIPLAGTGVNASPAVTLTPTSLVFPDLAVGSTSAAQTVTLNNTGQAPLSITGVTISGDFTQTNNCPASLAAAISCTISVFFKPTATGSRAGSVSIADNATPSPQTVSLTGTATAVFSLSSAATSATILIGTTSTTFTVAASAPSSFTSAITLSCESGVTCSFSPTSVMPGQSSTATVSGLSGTSSNPTNVIVDGSVGTSGSAGSQTAKLALSIFLQDFSVAASPGLNFVAQSGQSTMPINVTVTPANGFNQSVNLSCPTANLPMGVTCSFNPSSVTPSGSAVVSQLTVKTTVFSATSGPRAQPRPPLPGAPQPSGTPWLLLSWALALLTAWASRPSAARAERWTPRRVFAGSLPLAIVILLAAMATACQDYGTGPIGGTVGTGTPAGNYVIPITGTLGSNNTVTRSVAVNLSVG